MNWSDFVSKLIDLTGKQFGKLTVLYRDRSKRRVMWVCQCECGRKKSIRADALISGKTKSCGMCNNDLTGQKFGRLTVLYKNGTDKSGHLIWHCKCDCDNEVDVLATNLIQQYTQSCGCIHSEICSKRGEDLIGNKFGKLTVIELISIAPRKYLCQCECGGQAIVQPDNLKNGHTQSCGCISSLGQEIINTYLSDHRINFKSEYSISIFGFNGLARYDFAILDACKNVKFLIEYHGRQHFYPNTHFGGKEKFELMQERDVRKFNKCVENGVKMFYISFENKIPDDYFAPVYRTNEELLEGINKHINENEDNLCHKNTH